MCPSLFMLRKDFEIEDSVLQQNSISIYLLMLSKFSYEKVVAVNLGDCL